MAENFKKSNYVEILRKSMGVSDNLWKSKKIPNLEHVVLMNNAKIPGLLNWQDFSRIDSTSVATEL